MGSWKIQVETPAYVMLSSDYSQQEPKLTGFIANDPSMMKAFSEGKDIYATIASIAFGLPYEQCLEFNPDTHEYQPDGKARRGEAKSIVLGICYGRSVVTIGEQLYGKDTSLTPDDRTKKAQKVYDAVLNAFPQLRALMHSAQAHARKYGYTETILGRRRHLPDMQLPPFEFKAEPGYVNPYIDPLNIATLQDSNELPQSVVDSLTREFSQYKYYSQIQNRINELHNMHIRVINNKKKITDATRQCVNCVPKSTEILTVDGWNYVDDIRVGDAVYSYSVESGTIVRDTIKDIYTYEGNYPVAYMRTNSMYAVSTLDHRWICKDNLKGVSGNPSKLYTTREILDFNKKEQTKNLSLVCMAGNNFPSRGIFSRPELKIIAWILKDPDVEYNYYNGTITLHITSYTKDHLMNYDLYRDVDTTMTWASVLYDNVYWTSNSYKQCGVVTITSCDFLDSLFTWLPDGRLCSKFIQALSMQDARNLLHDYLNHRYYAFVPTRYDLDMLQYLCVIAGYRSHICEEFPNNTYYVEVLYENEIAAQDVFVEYSSEPEVWCVSTEQGSWIARNNGSVFITGNSMVQGSAADMTKMAIILLESNEEWKAIGGRLLVPVHDELICEVPMEYAERGAQILSDLMCKAGSFLPFPIKCDVEVSLRWYGLSYPCEYQEPEDLQDLTEDEIKWLQYHLLEMEYILPVYNDSSGAKPIGDAAKGINGVYSMEMQDAIIDYKNKYGLYSDYEFIQHIHNHVYYGRKEVLKDEN